MADIPLIFGTPRLAGSPTPLIFGDEGAPVTARVYVLLSGRVSVSAQVRRDTSIQLRFEAAPLAGTPTHLLFGTVLDEVVVRDPVLAEIAVQLSPNVEVAGQGVMPVRAEALVRLSGAVQVTSATFYDVRVTPWLDQRMAAMHQTALPDRRDLASESGVTLPQRLAPELPWQTAMPAENTAGAAFDAGVPQRLHAQGDWKTAVPTVIAAAAPHQKAEPQIHLETVRYQAAVQSVQQAASPMQTGALHTLHAAATWQWAQSKVQGLTGRSGASRRLRGAAQVSFPWQVAGQAKNGKSAWPQPQAEGPTVYPRDGHLQFECPPLAVAHLVFGARACYLPPVIPGTVIVPLLRTYVTINSITLRRVDGDMAIPAYAFQMSLDVESWTWSWSASVPADALPLVQPGSDGEPVEVEALVNGVPYRLYAEGVSRQRQFGQARIAVKGRGKAAMLDAPYAPSLNFGNLQARTAQQLMTDVLTVNGVGIGWAVDWNLTDWLVPGSTWTAQGAYIAAITAIAQAAGGYVQPHNTAQTLRILPRYPAAPWEWGSVTPDVELPSAVVSVEGIDWTRKADYNRVFVSGVANGVLGQVTRAGTAGNSVAPMVTDALITHADAARQRGLAILSDTGQQARVTLTVPVLSETGLIKPGQFVRYLDGGQSRLGLVRSTSLAWSRPKLRQTIAVETHA
ncbi:hypothetical protein [Polaromonas glacialis]|uniref:hypothetical protein n=1 Tax=Polaromonas glacialis TaxID=866564 RepID=UPI00068C00F2|nr:hypothetical protein [Polaromonas glacialis]